MAAEGLSSCLKNYCMIYRVNHLLAEEAHGISAYFFLKATPMKMSFLELSVAHSVLGFTIVIGECLPVKHESRALAPRL